MIVAGYPRPPMGPGHPLLVRQGDVALHKEQKNMRQRGSDHTGSFNQVRATVRRKTLLLLCWIDGGRMVAERSTVSRQGGSGYARMGVCVVQLSIPLYDCHGPPFIE